MLNLHKSLVSIYKHVCLLYLFLHLPQPLCVKHSISVSDSMMLSGPCWCSYSEKDCWMGKASPEWFVFSALVHGLLGYGGPAVCAARGFLIVLSSEWTINDVFLTWAEMTFGCFCLFCFFFNHTLIFLFKWIPMDCVIIWFMQLRRNEKTLRL